MKIMGDEDHFLELPIKRSLFPYSLGEISTLSSYPYSLDGVLIFFPCPLGACPLVEILAG